MGKAVFLCVVAAAFGGCAASTASPKPAEPPAAPTSAWQSAHPHADAPGAAVASTATVGELAAAIAGRSALACPSPLFVWGDVRVPDSARALRVMAGGTTLDGWAICEAELEGLLQAQRENPRLKQAHGGAAELRWADDHLLLRRRWGKGEAVLGDLATEPEGVLQKGELLAVIFTASDERAPAERVLAALRRVPTYFLFGMWQVSGRR